MSQRDEPWVRAAMSNVNVVAEILMRLHDSSHQPPPPANLKPLNWTVRQRRSNLIPHGSSKKPTHHLSSPTTPLSWSAGSEESTRSHVHVSTVTVPARSKVVLVNKEGCEKAAASKRSRKRKTIAELRDEESSLLKERRELKREIAALRTNLEKQRATNDNLKRMKNDLQQPLTFYEETSAADVSVRRCLNSSNDPSPMITSKADMSLRRSSSSGTDEDSDSSCEKFVIPDLNIPFEEENRKIEAHCLWSLDRVAAS